MGRAFEIDGVPIRTMDDLIAWDLRSAARFHGFRVRFRELLRRLESPDRGGVTREELVAARIAYTKAHEERERAHALFIRAACALTLLLADEHETLDEAVERVGPEAQVAFVHALVVGHEDQDGQEAGQAGRW